MDYKYYPTNSDVTETVYKPPNEKNERKEKVVKGDNECVKI